MAQDAILKTDSVYTALYTKINNDMTELFAIASEVTAARNGETNLDTRLDGMQTTIDTIESGSGILISTSDTTVGKAYDKTNVTAPLAKAIGTPGGNETLDLTISEATTSAQGTVEKATDAEAIARAADRAVICSNLAEAFKVKDYIKIPIEYASDGVTATAGEVDEYVSTNGKVWARTFSNAATQDVIIAVEVPEDIVVASGVKFKVHCVVTAATGPSAEGVAFLLSGYSIGSGDSINGTFGTQVESLATGRTDVQYDRFVTTLSGVVTVTDLAAGELMMLKLERDHDHASDTYGQLVGVTGVTLEIVRYLAP